MEMLQETAEEYEEAPGESVSDESSKHCAPSKDEELSELFNSASLAGTKPSVVDPNLDDYVLKCSQKSLESLRDPSFIHLKDHKLCYIGFYTGDVRVG